MQDISFINGVFYVLVLIFSVVIHEISHGLMADELGDSTARMEGRLTLNPLVHIDLFGSIILPLLLVLTGSPFLVGWAKPVPFNPRNFMKKDWIHKYGEALVALAGPASNLAIALIFGLFLRFFGGVIANQATLSIMSTIVLVNVVLAVFNLVPIPPLDGSKILFAFLPYNLRNIRTFLEANALILSLIFIVFLWKFISPLVIVVYKLILGI